MTPYDGSLSLVRRGVVSSGGTLPDSVAVSGNLVYVANSGADDANYTGFRLGFDGRLTAAPGSPFKAEGLGPFGSEFRPTDPDQLFVSNAHNTGADSGTISAFTDSRNGTLTSVAGSPFADDQMAPCWVEISHDGQFLFTVNTASGTISRFQIDGGGALTLLGSTPVSQTGGVGAVDARLSPDGRYLFVDESRIGKVGAFAVNGGNLTELASSPTSLAAGATPAGIVAS